MENKYKLYSPTDLLRVLCEAFGPSGCEGNVADIIIDDGELAYDQLRDKILDEFQKMVTE